jgi:hypothetical protein
VFLQDYERRRAASLPALGSEVATKGGIDVLSLATTPGYVAIVIDPAATPTVRVEGPPPGIASGRWDVPRWTIGVVGGAIVAVGAVYLVVRVVRRGARS